MTSQTGSQTITIHISSNILRNKSNQAMKYDVPSAKVWERNNAVMIETATKNLSTEKYVANTLDSDHIPYHLIFKSHTVEALRHLNLESLKQIRIQFLKGNCWNV